VPEDGRPVVFIHGLWLHASSWGAWLQLFEASGYAPVAPGWPGAPDWIEDARAHPGAVAGKGIDDIVAHYTNVIAALETPPILIGHSFGGLIAQRLLGEGLGAGAVAIDAAPIKGVIFLPPSALRVASVALRNPANRHRAISLSPGQFHYGFANTLPHQEVAALYQQWTAPSPGKPLFEAASANLSRHSPAKVKTDNDARGPLLLIAGGKDHTVPAAVTKQTHKLYRRSAALTSYHEFADRGHSLCIDHGWREVADMSLAWLKSESL
jgi:pimeloyl-ACP methyl ester carboxylesterase